MTAVIGWRSACRLGIGLLAVAAAMALLPAAITRAEPAAVVGGPGQILEDNAGHIRRFVVHIPAGELEHVAPTLRSWLPQLARDVQGEFLCARSEDAAALGRRFVAWKLAAPQRFRIHRYGKVETIWARDRYLALRGPLDRVVLLRPPQDEHQFDGDFGVPEFLARHVPRLSVRQASLYWEGGDLIAGRQWVFVGATTLRRLKAQLATDDADRIRRVLETQFGRRVLFVPQPDDVLPSDVYLDYHLDMFLTVVHDESVLLADVDWGRRLVKELPPWMPRPAAPVDEILPQELRRRLEAVHWALAQANVPVRRVPWYPVPGQHFAATYNNVLQDELPGQRRVYLPQYGLAELDREAAWVYGRLGYRVGPVNVSSLFPRQGTLRCLVNVMERSAPVSSGVSAPPIPGVPSRPRGRPSDR